MIEDELKPFANCRFSSDLVFVMSELQPRSAQFTRHWPHIHFVGPCVDEEARARMQQAARADKHSGSVKQAKYMHMLDEFLATQRRHSLVLDFDDGSSPLGKLVKP